jgi:hypothetical protein
MIEFFLSQLKKFIIFHLFAWSLINSFLFSSRFWLNIENHYVWIDKVFDWSVWTKSAKRDKAIKNIEINATLLIIIFNVELYYK